MQPQQDQTPWQQPYQQPAPPWSASAPKQRGSSGHTALLWAILALLVVNLCLTLYIFGVVHQVVSGVQSVFGG